MKHKVSGKSAGSDADLLARTRAGDEHAYGALWRRYSRKAIVVASSSQWSSDAEDLVAEAFTRIYQAIRAGKGPTSTFRPYLFMTMRNLAITWGRARREVPIAYIESVQDPRWTEETASVQFDASLASTAILTLPSRWQEVLWCAEIEDLSMAEIGARLRIGEHAAATLAFRAREGLRHAWITAHLKTRAPQTKECRWALGKLARHARGRLGSRDEQRVRAHLEPCVDCRAQAEEALNASSRLHSIPQPDGHRLSGAGRGQAPPHGPSRTVGAPGLPVRQQPASPVIAGEDLARKVDSSPSYQGGDEGHSCRHGSPVAS